MLQYWQRTIDIYKEFLATSPEQLYMHPGFPAFLFDDTSTFHIANGEASAIERKLEGLNAKLMFECILSEYTVWQLQIWCSDLVLLG